MRVGERTRRVRSDAQAAEVVAVMVGRRLGSAGPRPLGDDLPQRVHVLARERRARRAARDDVLGERPALRVAQRQRRLPVRAGAQPAESVRRVAVL